jgi:hypothetical protein
LMHRVQYDVARPAIEPIQTRIGPIQGLAWLRSKKDGPPWRIDQLKTIIGSDWSYHGAKGRHRTSAPWSEIRSPCTHLGCVTAFAIRQETWFTALEARVLQTRVHPVCCPTQVVEVPIGVRPWSWSTLADDFSDRRHHCDLVPCLCGQSHLPMSHIMSELRHGFASH